MTAQVELAAFKLGSFVQPPARHGKGQPVGRISTVVTTERLDGHTERKYGVRFFEPNSSYHSEHLSFFFAGELVLLTGDEVAEFNKR
jgi:hypothetical protein